MNLKKIFLLLVTALFLLSLYGCNTSSSSNNPTEQTTVTDTDDLSLDSDIETTELNHDLDIYNNDKKIDTLNLFDALMPINGGLIYSKINKDSPNEMEYYRYYLDKKNSVKLGSIKNWSMQIHDKAYVNNHLCFMASTATLQTKKTELLNLLISTLIKTK